MVVPFPSWPLELSRRARQTGGAGSCGPPKVGEQASCRYICILLMSAEGRKLLILHHTYMSYFSSSKFSCLSAYALQFFPFVPKWVVCWPLSRSCQGRPSLTSREGNPMPCLQLRHHSLYSCSLVQLGVCICLFPKNTSPMRTGTYFPELPGPQERPLGFLLNECMSNE